MPKGQLSRNAGVVVAILTAVAFAGSGPFVKPLVLEGWSPAAAVWMRVTFAGLILLPISLIAARHDLAVFARRWKWIVGYGVTAIAATQLLYYTALSLMPVSIALLLQYLSPILLLLVAWAQTRHRPAWLSLGGAALSVIGLVLSLDLGSAGAVSPLGIVFGVGAAVAVCGYYLIAAAMPDDLPPVALAGGGLMLSSVVTAIVGALGLLPMTFVFGEVTLFGGRAPWWASMAVVVLVGTIVGYLGGIVAAKAIGSRLASFLGLIEVVATIAISAFMLGEIPSLVQLVGAAIVLAGVVCVRLAPDTVSLEAPLGPLTAPITLPVELPRRSPAAKAQAERLETGRIAIIDLPGNIDPERAVGYEIVEVMDPIEAEEPEPRGR